MKDPILTRMLHENAEAVFTDEIKEALFHDLKAELDATPQGVIEMGDNTMKQTTHKRGKRGLWLVGTVAAAFAFVWIGLSAGGFFSSGGDVTLEDPQIPLSDFDDPSGEVILEDGAVPLNPFVEEERAMTVVLFSEQGTLYYPIGSILSEEQIIADCDVFAIPEGTLVIEDMTSIDTTTSGTAQIHLSLVGPDGVSLATLPITVVITE